MYNKRSTDNQNNEFTFTAHNANTMNPTILHSKSPNCHAFKCNDTTDIGPINRPDIRSDRANENIQ